MAEDREAILNRARALGLEKAAEEFPDDVVSAWEAAQKWIGGLPRDHHMYDEPAGVYRPGAAGEESGR